MFVVFGFLGLVLVMVGYEWVLFVILLVCMLVMLVFVLIVVVYGGIFGVVLVIFIVIVGCNFVEWLVLCWLIGVNVFIGVYRL